MTDRIYLRGTVPIWVEVDLEAGEVWKVTVGDEYIGELEVETWETEASTPEEIKEALRIAADTDWPEWSFG